MNRLGSRGGWVGLLPGVTALCACSLLFTGLLWSGVASSAGLQLRYDVILLPLGLGAAYFGLARGSREHVLPWLTIISVGICGVVLSGVWGAAVSDLSLQAGIFQQSDSFTKLDGSVRLFLEGELSTAASRRPLAPAIGAALLSACQGNVRGMLGLTVFLVALTLALPVREIIRTHGWTAGFTLHLALLFYYRRFIGTCLTEHVGLALGCLAFALLWRSARHARTMLILAGLFVLTLALSARAGAFFVLPALALWAGRARRGGARFSATVCVLGCVAAGAGFALNSVVLHAVGTPGTAMGNFSYTLYGLVNGGDWTKVLQDHPELRRLPEIERNKAIYDLALGSIAQRPASLAGGAIRAYRSFFLSSEGPYSFMRFSLQRSRLRRPPPGGDAEGHGLRRIAADPWKYLHIATTQGWFLGLSALALAGLFTLIPAREPESGLLVWAGAGILASVPFAPPWDADLMRAYAATMPFMLAFPAVGLSAIAARWGRRNIDGRDRLPTPERGTGLLLLAMVAVPALCLAPLLLRQRPSPAPQVADANGARWTLRLLPGSQVRLGTGRESAAWSRSVDRAEALGNTGVLSFMYPDREAELAVALTSGGTLAMGYDRRAQALRYLLLDATQADRLGSGWTEVVAEPLAGGDEALWWKIRAPGDLPPGAPPDPGWPPRD